MCTCGIDIATQHARPATHNSDWATAGENPNGAVDDVAGVCNAAGNVFGLMPHPEHAVDPRLGSVDGALILGSLIDAAQLSSAALV